MPIYEFHCEKCDSDFEQLFRSMEAEAKARCPRCGAARTRRKLSLFGMSVASSRGEASRSAGRSSCSSCARSSCAGCRR
ncbi:MAG: zinc ribbon domain-containing protein [Planctomycetes bacterium]|nr:zinc ribbon domain-containing protein [Planctomycetota bacterium]